jgi:hypothetical protein
MLLEDLQLQPVPRQLVVDVVTLMGMLQSTWMMAQAVSNSAAPLQRSALVLLTTGLWIILSTSHDDSRFTNRWTLTVTWIGVTVLHLLHRFLSQKRISRYHFDSLHWLLTILCTLIVYCIRRRLVYSLSRIRADACGWTARGRYWAMDFSFPWSTQ